MNTFCASSYGLLLLCFLMPCTKDPLIQISESSHREVTTNSLSDGATRNTEQRTKREALLVAQAFLNEKSNESSEITSSQKEEVYFDIDCILNPDRGVVLHQTDGTVVPVDTIFYILNKREGGGFFIISGDKRVPDILAFYEEGHLDLSQIEREAEVKVFFR